MLGGELEPTVQVHGMGSPVDLEGLQCSPVSLGCGLDSLMNPSQWSVGTCGRVLQFHSARLPSYNANTYPFNVTEP